MDDDGLGFPNIELSAGSSVEGCLYMIKQEELDKLDACVGYPEVIYIYQYTILLDSVFQITVLYSVTWFMNFA